MRSALRRVNDYQRGLRGLGYDVTHVAGALARIVRRAYASLRARLERS